jgi:4-hydroxy-tetrahydrodipicolinate reductase
VNEIRVVVRGAAGRMGRQALAALRASGQSPVPAPLRCVLELQRGDEQESLLSACEADVALDLTVPAALELGVPRLLRAGLDVVVGTSGARPEQIQEWRRLCDELGRSLLIVPNFCIGVVLLQQFAVQAAKFFPDVELIEMHHERKADHPSGTATDTARRIAAARSGRSEARLAPEDPTRSQLVDGVPVHALRLPGLLAHQLVLLGAPGETLTLRHDTSDRAAFMPGLLLALRRVSELGGLRVGLEHVLSEGTSPEAES